ncbi:hypothetical protein GCM10009616_28950 [Microlunatus lacustris]
MTSSTPPQTTPQEVWERPFVKTHETWCGDFVLELRLRDIPGPVIGERLGEVEGHCAETGETPVEAFGDPTSYAARIAEDGSPERVSGVWTVTAVAAAQVLAMLVGTSAVTAWVRGEPLTYNAVQIICLGAVAVLLLLLPFLLRPLLRHPWTFGLPLTAVVFLGVGGAALSGRSDLPAVLQLPATAVAVGLFVAVLVLAWVEYRELAGDDERDLVTSPLTPAPGRPKTTSRHRLWTALLPACLIPATYLVLATFNWLIA